MIARATGLFGLWLLLTRAESADLAIGVATAGAAAWVSARLLPVRSTGLRIGAFVPFAIRVVRQSFVAGIDVARRALAPSLPMRPGFVSHRLELPDGPARDVFCALTSLAPGAVPAGTDEDGALVVHTIDERWPVAAQLADDEARFARALGGRRDG